MSAYQDGIEAGDRLGRVLYELGFPWSEVGNVGLKFSTHLEAQDLAESDFLRGFHSHFDGLKESPPGERRRDLLRVGMGPSEWSVITDLIGSVSEVVQEQMPHSADPIYEVLDLYAQYLEATGADQALVDRLARIRQGVSDAEDRASGRA